MKIYFASDAHLGARFHKDPLAIEKKLVRWLDSIKDQDAIRSSKDSYLLFRTQLCDLPYEELWIALTNPLNKVIQKVKISQGGVNQTSVDIRLVLKAAINALASGIILCHNHPSGSLRPSTHDDALTERIQKAAKLMDIRILDHIILSDSGYYSYADEGRLVR